MKIEEREAKRKQKKEPKRKGKTREKEILFSPVFSKPITCLVLYSFLHIYYYFPKLEIH